MMMMVMMIRLVRTHVERRLGNLLNGDERLLKLVVAGRSKVVLLSGGFLIEMLNSPSVGFSPSVWVISGEILWATRSKLIKI